MILEENKYTSRRLRSTTISTVVSISLILFTLGLLGLLILDARKISEYVKEHIQLVVFLNDDADPVAVSAMQDLLGKAAFAKSVRYVSKEEALDSLKQSLGESAVSMLDNNPLPASFDINMRAGYANSDSLPGIVNKLSSNPLVREVSYQENEIGLLNKNLKTIGLIILVFSGLLFLIAFALINNMVRLSIYSKRFLIKSMQLVGATKGFIRRPFIRRGFIHGLYGGIIACLLLAGLLYLVHMEFSDLARLQDFQTLALLFAGIILAGLLLSGISTFFAVRKYLRLTTDDLYF